LGTAANYAVVAPNGFSINGPGTINGDVASGNKTVLTSPAVIKGAVSYSGSISGNATVFGAVQTASLSQVFADAQSASTAAFALTATQTFGTISKATTITGNGGTNVIDLSGINLSNGALTLNGSASDVFIVNVQGNITSSNSNIAISGGVTPNHVLINVSGNVTITGGGPNNFYGTILDPTGQVTVHDKLLTGELIGNIVTDTSGFSVNYQPFTPPCGCMPPPPPPCSTASIAGTVFTDTTGDHILNWGDTGIGGVEVDLLNASGQVVTTTTTAADGTFHFNGLAAGTYSVQTIPPVGTKVMYPDVGSAGGNVNSTDTGITNITVTGGQAAWGYYFGVYNTAS
jgi:hypothetical protein